MKHRFRFEMLPVLVLVVLLIELSEISAFQPPQYIYCGDGIYCYAAGSPFIPDNYLSVKFCKNLSGGCEDGQDVLEVFVPPTKCLDKYEKWTFHGESHIQCDCIPYFRRKLEYGNIKYGNCEILSILEIINDISFPTLITFIKSDISRYALWICPFIWLAIGLYKFYSKISSNFDKGLPQNWIIFQVAFKFPVFRKFNYCQLTDFQ